MSTSQTSAKKSTRPAHHARIGGTDRARTERFPHGYSVQSNVAVLVECDDGCHFCAGPETD